MEFQYLEDHRYDGLRSGESSAAALRDGGILLLYSAFRGGGHADHSPAEIWARRSPDGVAWTPPLPLFRVPEGALNVSSPSLLRLLDGRIACVFAVKWSTTRCIPHWTASSDEGASWSAPKPMTAHEEYFVINNDRLVQMRDGTLIMPYACHRGIVRYANDKELLKDYLNGWCGLLVSDDAGKSWRMPANARRFEPDWFVEPSPLRMEGMPDIERRALREKYDVFQEPGVIELSEGRLLLWVRSLSHIFFSVSAGVDAPWPDYAAIPGMNVSCSPQTIKRIPDSGELVMLYNDRGTTPFGSPEFQFRTPLSVAISTDEGCSWSKRGELESDQSRSYCYPSLLFHQGQFLASYYESAASRTAEGLPSRRNLASLKVCRGHPAELLR